MMNNLFNKTALTVFALVLFTVLSCKKKDDELPPVDGVIAGFQYEISTTNPFEVSFSNFSSNATSYSWDFGDGNTSTEESPTHTYAAGGTYSVTLTASDGVDEADRTEDIIITDPDAALNLLAGNSSKTWHLQREGVALGVGPNMNDNTYWSFGGSTPLGERPCILDDTYTFHTDGTWEFTSNGTLFIDNETNGGWLGSSAAEGCYDENEAGIFTAATGEDVSAFGDGGSYTYDYNTAEGTITLDGLGAYIGLPVKTAEGNNYIPQSSKTYTIFNFVAGDIADTLQMSIAGGDFWNFYLVSYHDIADLPDIPTAMPVAGFTIEKSGFTINCTNTSAASTSYSWDFGDGNMSTETNPSHTYTDEGSYTVTLTAMDDMAQSDMTSQEVIISTATFTPDVLSTMSGKIWKLDGEGSYYVGPTLGSNEWWPGPFGDDFNNRVCQFDDEFIFFDNGTMEYDTKGDVYAEAYMGGPNACIPESDLNSPYDVFASGTHSFTADATTITVMGNGAFFGFNKANNEGELDGVVAPASQIVYEVVEYTNVGNKETITFGVNYIAGYWTMRVFSEN